MQQTLISSLITVGVILTPVGFSVGGADDDIDLDELYAQMFEDSLELFVQIPAGSPVKETVLKHPEVQQISAKLGYQYYSHAVFNQTDDEGEF